MAPAAGFMRLFKCLGNFGLFASIAIAASAGNSRGEEWQSLMVEYNRLKQKEASDKALQVAEKALDIADSGVEDKLFRVCESLLACVDASAAQEKDELSREYTERLLTILEDACRISETLEAMTLEDATLLERHKTLASLNDSFLTRFDDPQLRFQAVLMTQRNERGERFYFFSKQRGYQSDDLGLWSFVPDALVREGNRIRNSGDLEEAELAYRKALRASEAVWGKRSAQSADAHAHLADVYSRQGKSNLAIALLRGAAEIYASIEGEEEAAALCFDQLAIWLERNDETAEAESSRAKAQAFRKVPDATPTRP